MAAAGITVLFFRISSSKRIFTNWFGHKRIVFVVEDGFELAGAGGLVDLIVDGQQFAGGKFGLIVAAVGIDLERALSPYAARRPARLSSGSVNRTAMG